LLPQFFVDLADLPLRIHAPNAWEHPILRLAEHGCFGAITAIALILLGALLAH
jgi:hypothetical protein